MIGVTCHSLTDGFKDFFSFPVLREKPFFSPWWTHSDRLLEGKKGGERGRRVGVQKSETFFLASLDELDHSKHFLKCPSKSLTFDLPDEV